MRNVQNLGGIKLVYGSGAEPALHSQGGVLVWMCVITPDTSYISTSSYYSYLTIDIQVKSELDKDLDEDFPSLIVFLRWKVPYPLFGFITSKNMFLD